MENTDEAGPLFYVVANDPAVLVDTPEALTAALARWQDRPWLALDTEFVREDTYFPKLGLIQVADAAGAMCVDAVALDLAPLLQQLAGVGTVKVFHAAGQDLEILVRLAGDCPRPLFDTQIAAALLGHGEQTSYAALMAALLGVAVDKGLSRTDWIRRPIPPPALRYAADDVIYLAEAYVLLRKRLEERGRLSWLEEDCARKAQPAQYRPDVEHAWQRLRGLAALAPRGQRIAARLAQWREAEAIARDRPRRWILADEVLIAIARRAPADEAALAGVAEMPAGTVKRHAAALLAGVAQGMQDPPIALAEDWRPSPEVKAVLNRLSTLLKEIAAELEVAPTLIATRADLQALARLRDRATTDLLTGWRLEVAGRRLLGTLN